MKKPRCIRLVSSIAFCLIVLLLAPNVALAFNMISIPGFERAIKQYEKRAHWEPAFTVTTDFDKGDPFSPSEGCICTITTRSLRLFDSQETPDLKQWASFELTVVDRECEGDIDLEGCYTRVNLLTDINAYVHDVSGPGTTIIFRYSIPGVEGASEMYSEHNPDFENRRTHAIMFWEKYADQ